jgi:acyl dehydratase
VYMGDYLEYEELMPGRKFRSPGRTLSEADVVTFAGLSGDYAEFAYK